ncbi:DUF1287 domain-containing protein [Alkalihalobacillus sp. AL-G]|uniref:DUF1287 domain-containing protein n=1 Tax=Alkalihalobacillus sp. AL-G TaxID=2926399 RepID=UPI00272DB126|nr:DUF1287 domain-containing protein [Alkalihalobacillus sp. AL-G]WLD93834.1 DUF1287 domain-containing protein [Alkalihalobacillus sp. AL-G]
MQMKKILKVLFSLLFVGLIAFVCLFRDGIILDTLGIHIDNPFKKTVHVPDTYTTVDRNENGIADPIDIVNAAREEVEQRTEYQSAYYNGGYPPDDEGVCTDVIWRGLLGADINLKDLIDQDIAAHTDLYPRVNGNPDPNIDFRRVPNQHVYFERFTESLTTELIPGNIENLKKWQPGDVVMFLDGYHHVVIISDKRAKDGTPYVIQNNEPFASEVKLTSFSTPIAAHYRWKY